MVMGMRVPRWFVFVFLGLVLLGLAIGLLLSLGQATTPSPAASSLGSVPLPEGALVGKPALAFELKDPYGQPYTLSPGDGKAHLLVFYMGYF